MCALNQTKRGKMTFSHLFHMHLAITISAMVLGRLSTMSKIKVFLHRA